MLFSLSRAGTITGLHWSELAVLIFGFLFLAGWILEEFTKSERWKNFHRLFLILAICGVTGEWIADIGIFELTEHLDSIDESEIMEVRHDTASALERAANAEAHLADAKKTATEAEARAAEANEKAEGEKLARVAT
jgi:hypothetical protein